MLKLVLEIVFFTWKACFRIAMSHRSLYRILFRVRCTPFGDWGWHSWALGAALCQLTWLPIVLRSVQVKANKAAFQVQTLRSGAPGLLKPCRRCTFRCCSCLVFFVWCLFPRAAVEVDSLRSPKLPVGWFWSTEECSDPLAVKLWPFSLVISVHLIPGHM